MNQRPDPMFIADALGLDFLNSVASPIGEPVEWLASGDDLLAWLGKAGLLEPEAASIMREHALPGELDAVAARARALREWFRGFVMAHRGAPLTAHALSDLEPLNRVLARDEQYAQVEPGETGLTLVMRRRWRSPDALLAPIAGAIADVICADGFEHIKACEGSSCTLLFADHTNRRARRWCSMAVCGNRAKQAAHRGRRQTMEKQHEEAHH